ncbi:MAG: 5'/3'-nucleotidase SurE [Clostridiales Family XIII bacterium]|jgi:5'-nucleotidase|nr:5'/3'-nucleotidase SurE [Clostridiales Family XIII bacterium]
MNILLTNDDGIEAEGIAALAEALGAVADVYVFSPKEQKSASGHSITISKPIEVREVASPFAVKSFAVDGTPADCVKLGCIIMEKLGAPADKVVSGANHGMNLGTDTLYSGTVSAALEGALCGKPSVAVSVGHRWPTIFEVARRMAVWAALLPLSALGAGEALNINVPHLPLEDVKGIRATRLGRMEYEEAFREEESRDGARSFYYAGRPSLREGLPLDIDIAAHRAGWVTVTPLMVYLTDSRRLEGLGALVPKSVLEL